jgi:hypothetical protein
MADNVLDDQHHVSVSVHQHGHPHRRWILDKRLVQLDFVGELGVPERLVGAQRLDHHRHAVAVAEREQGLVADAQHLTEDGAVIGAPSTSPWLFPGGQPGRALSAFRMAERLNQLGIRSGQSRFAALFQLATDLPAAVLARMLGIHISVAVAWQRASSGDWMTYAAEVSRRNPH